MRRNVTIFALLFVTTIAVAILTGKRTKYKIDAKILCKQTQRASWIMRDLFSMTLLMMSPLINVITNFVVTSSMISLISAAIVI